MKPAPALISLVAFVILGLNSCVSPVKPGSDILTEQRLDLVRNKRVGLVTNHTGRLSSGAFLVDVLRSKGITVVALFGPEHGVRGEASAGEAVRDTQDAKTGIRIFSLYGKTPKPTPDMLQDVDVLIYDIQDVGARFYTYISTMALSMEAAAEKGIPFIVLDRPNPLGGMKVDGPIRADSLKSFVGMFPIPVMYGMTCGELAQMINGERWLAHGVQANLTVVTLEGWTRDMLWKQTGLQWVPPSPNIPAEATAIVYPATCLLEATNLSEGRGTDRPFETFGAPFVNADSLCASLKNLKLPGVGFHPASFTPRSSKYEGRSCQGVSIDVSDPGAFRPTVTGLSIMQQIQKMYPGDLTISERSLGRLLGLGDAKDELTGGVSPDQMEAKWKESLDEFQKRASRYYLYGNG